MIPREAHHKSADHALDDFNRVIAHLLLGGLFLDPVGLSELAFGTLNHTGYFRYSQPIGSTARLHQAFGERGAGASISIDLFQPTRIARTRVEEAYQRGAPAMHSINSANLANFASAFSSLQHSRYRDAMVNGWTFVEQLIAQLWLEVFLARHTLFDGRKKSLEQATRNVATTIEFLVQAKIVGQEAYQHLAVARRARNRYIHTGKSPSAQECRHCILGGINLIAALCDHNGNNFQPAPILAEVCRKPAPNNNPKGVVQAADVDWSQQLLYRVVKPIPGDETWDGAFETFPDIELARA